MPGTDQGDGTLQAEGFQNVGSAQNSGMWGFVMPRGEGVLDDPSFAKAVWMDEAGVLNESRGTAIRATTGLPHAVQVAVPPTAAGADGALDGVHVYGGMAFNGDDEMVGLDLDAALADLPRSMHGNDVMEALGMRELIPNDFEEHWCDIPAIQTFTPQAGQAIGRVAAFAAPPTPRDGAFASVRLSADGDDMVAEATDRFMWAKARIPGGAAGWPDRARKRPHLFDSEALARVAGDGGTLGADKYGGMVVRTGPMSASDAGSRFAMPGTMKPFASIAKGVKVPPHTVGLTVLRRLAAQYKDGDVVRFDVSPQTFGGAPESLTGPASEVPDGDDARPVPRYSSQGRSASYVCLPVAQYKKMLSLFAGARDVHVEVADNVSHWWTDDGRDLIAMGVRRG